MMSSEKKTACKNDNLANESHDVPNVTQSNKPAKLVKQSGVDEESMKSPRHINLNVTISTKPKVLVRSQTFSGDDDSGVSARHTPASRFFASRSTFSSASFDSSHGRDYTDSTGINLLSFITCTLHKNAKDRNMLLQLEQQMTKLIKDSTRNSQKFPAMSSYNRMLVHRVAAFFGLNHNVDQNGTAVVVNKTSHTRLPDIDFLSLIQSDVYTDESRRFLRRDAQSYEEVGQSWGPGLISGRRTRSFEVGDCLSVDPTTITVGCALPVTAPLQLHLLHQQGSTSSTASSTHLLESPGSCYSYGDMPVMNVYSVSESSPSFNSTTHVFPWNSSKSYTRLSADYPSNIISPVMHNQPQPPVITREVNIDMSTSLHRTLNNRSFLPEQRASVSRHIYSDCHRWEMSHSMEASVPENSFRENVHFDNEYGMEMAVSQQQTQSVFATSPMSTDFVTNQCIVNSVPEHTTYAVVPSYLRYTLPTLSIQKLTHQMDFMCAAVYPEVVPVSQSFYLPQSQTMYPQQVSGMYPPHPCFLPVLQRNCVSHYPVSNDECSSSIQQGNPMEAVRTTKNGSIFERPATVMENESVSN